MHTYFCVASGYFSHRKTMRLIKSLKSETAALLPLRLWEYASVNQRNGRFAKYADDELAVILKVPAQRVGKIKTALVDAGYLDKSLKLHDWDYWNAYFINFAASERQSQAAKKRWGKQKGRRDESPPPENLNPNPAKDHKLEISDRKPTEPATQGKGNPTASQTLWKMKQRVDALAQLIDEHPARDVQIYAVDSAEIVKRKQHDISHLKALKAELKEARTEIANFKE